MSDWEESLGCAIENAAGCLPKNYMLNIKIEHGGYACSLDTPGGEITIHDAESIVDEIEALTAIAVQSGN